MEYQEQLTKLSWKIKRQQIIERDNCTCQNCMNESYLKSTLEYSPVEFINKEIYHIEVLDPEKFDEGYEEKISFECKSFPEKVNFKKFYASFYEAEKHPNHENIFNNKNISLYYKNENGNAYGIALFDLEKKAWIYIKDLHVHHKYYQIGKLAWDYPDDAYVTYCWDCHLKIHENSEIDVLDENGNLIEKKLNCPRCGGAGYFPEYRKIENGVCFLCRGKRYID